MKQKRNVVWHSFRFCIFAFRYFGSVICIVSTFEGEPFTIHELDFEDRDVKLSRRRDDGFWRI